MKMQSHDSPHEHFTLFEAGAIFGVTTSISSAPVPLPSTLGLLGVGLAGLALARRRANHLS
jgi:hypothetical protein